MRTRHVLTVTGLLAGLLLTGAPTAAGQVETPGADTGTFTALTYNVAGLPEPPSGSEPSVNSPR